MKKLNNNGFTALEIILIILVVGSLGASGYFVYKSQNRAQNKETTTPSTSESAKQTEEPTEAKPKQELEVSGRSKSEATIRSVMNKGDYKALESVMAKTVKYSRQSSDTDGEAPRSHVAGHINGFLTQPSVAGDSPWDFDVMKNDSAFAAKIQSLDSAYAGGFPYNDDAFIGRSSDGGMFFAFQFNEQGLVKTIWYGFTATL